MITSNLSRSLPALISALCSVLLVNAYCSRVQRVQPSSMFPPVHGEYIPMRGALTAMAFAGGAAAGVETCMPRSDATVSSVLRGAFATQTLSDVSDTRAP